MLNALLMVALFTSADTTFVFAETRRDMTGDSLDEHMVLLASGDPTDSLLMTFRIEGQDRVLYTGSFVVDRVIGFDAGRHEASEEEWESVLGFYRDFFADQKFEIIGAFVERRLPPSFKPPEHIDILSDVPVFRYSPGGDRVYSLVWSDGLGQFVDLFPCC